MFAASYKCVVYRGLKVLHSEYPYYRLNDMLRISHKRQESCNHDGLNTNPHCDENENWEQYHVRNFPNSIVVKFLQKSEGEKRDVIATLWSILKTLDSPFKPPDSDTVVLHLRVGDVIDRTTIRHGSEFWENKINTWQASGKYSAPEWANYTITKHDFDSLPWPPEAKKVCIVYGFHTREDHTKSIEYLQAVEESLSKRFAVSFETHENADDALRYMSHAKYFIPSGGGFSRLCANMVAYNRGTIIRA